MSYVELTPLSPEIPAHIQMSPSDAIMTDAQSREMFGRGLAFGLVLGLSFWTFVAIELFGG